MVATFELAGSNFTIPAASVPTAPRSPRAVAGDTRALVSFLPPVYGTPTSYTVTASPGGATATVSASPATITGLTNGTPYTFSVVASNAVGPGAAAVSAAVTPSAAPTGLSAITGLLAWWKASTLALADGASVTTWSDISGNGYSAAQSGVNRPTYKASWTNGKPAVELNGGSTAQFLQSTLAALSTASTVFIVFDFSSSTNTPGYKDQRLFSSQRAATSDPGLNIDLFASSGNAIRVLNSGGVATSSAALAANTPCILSLTTLAGSVFKSGVKVSSPPVNGLTLNGATFTIGNTVSGSGKQLAGRIAEILFYDRLLTDAERHDVEAYLSAEYAISVVQQ